MPKYQDDPLRDYDLRNFSGGYNSYTASRALVKENEIPDGRNVVLDDNGSVTKRGGTARFGAELASGKAPKGIGVIKTTSINKLIVACGTSWYDVDSTTSVALGGATFTDDLDTDFVQGVDRLYGANGTDNLAYTDDGANITSVTSNGNIGRWPVVYGQRLYMTNTTYPDRVYYSNPTTYSTTSSSAYAIGDFGTFNIDLSATPKKNAGFIILMPGSGLEITRLFKDSSAGTDYVYVYTKEHGIWRIAYASVNSDGSIAHTISQVVTADGSPAGKSVIKVGNDQWFRSKWNYSSLGEAAQYQNIRISTKGGRVKSEADAVAGSDLSKIAAGFYKEQVYFSYPLGTYNDRALIYDTRLNAWSAPLTNFNINRYLEWIDDTDTSYFLGLSANSSDSYVYRLDTGTNDNSTAIDAYFDTKSTDCGYPGRIKRFAFIEVFYSQIVGELTYQVFIDEDEAVTSALQFGSSASATSGIGSKIVGSFTVGSEFTAGSSTGIVRNDSFRIDCSYTAGKKIYVRFSNANVSENFKIDAIKIYYLLGDVYET